MAAAPKFVELAGITFLRAGTGRYTAIGTSDRGPCLKTLRWTDPAWTVELAYPDGTFTGRASSQELAFVRAAKAAWIR